MDEPTPAPVKPTEPDHVWTRREEAMIDMALAEKRAGLVIPWDEVGEWFAARNHVG